MKLLIVDDEKLTREGIRDSLNLDKLGIDQVFLADDGIHGLEIADIQRPHIILTDVRMPRINGVEMAGQIVEKLPEASVIFMSAYSDKEYLKAAIKLKAVSYVEKPLDMKELETALMEAVKNCREKQSSQAVARLQERGLIEQLSLLLAESVKADDPKALSLIRQMELPITSSTYFTAIVIKTISPLSELPRESLLEFKVRYDLFLKSHGLLRLAVSRGDRFIISFLYGPQKPEDHLIASCAHFIRDGLKDICSFFIAIGSSVNGMDRAYLSCQQALETLKRSFFHEYHSILMPQKPSPVFHPPADVMMDFTIALTEHKKEQALLSIQTLYESIRFSEILSPSQVRDLYLRYLSKLDEISLSNYISLWQREGLDSESIWESVMGCFVLSDLNQLLYTKVQLYFERLRQNREENPVIFQIKEYLHQNYPVQTLSVPDVSEYVHLSSSYVCTLFKNATGQTLNQYLTDYRIKMSKQFLSDPRYKISDISLKVGYSDGNYYSKTFRKLVGLSPSEYREKMLS